MLYLVDDLTLIALIAIFPIIIITVMFFVFWIWPGKTARTFIRAGWWKKPIVAIPQRDKNLLFAIPKNIGQLWMVKKIGVLIPFQDAILNASGQRVGMAYSLYAQTMDGSYLTIVDAARQKGIKDWPDLEKNVQEYSGSMLVNPRKVGLLARYRGVDADTKRPKLDLDYTILGAQRHRDRLVADQRFLSKFVADADVEFKDSESKAGGVQEALLAKVENGRAFLVKVDNAIAQIDAMNRDLTGAVMITWQYLEGFMGEFLSTSLIAADIEDAVAIRLAEEKNTWRAIAGPLGLAMAFAIIVTFCIVALKAFNIM